MNDFRKLRVWHKSHALVLAVYRTTAAFPPSERSGLVSQMRRAVVSIAANLAESCGRRGDYDQARFRQIAFGSATELEYELELARDLAYLDPPEHTALVTSLVEVKKMLARLVTQTRVGARRQRIQTSDRQASRNGPDP